MPRITVTIDLAAHDDDVAGGLGAVTWLEARSCTITTDDERALMRRLRRDENVEIVEVEDH